MKRELTRWQADLLLLLTAVIWGMGFVAQKTGMNGLGPFGFTAVRFVLSFLIVLPLAWREHQSSRPSEFPQVPGWQQLLLVVLFFGGVTLQQVGLQTSHVTNAGFLTTLYVIFVPILDVIFFRIRPRAVIIPAAIMAVLGVWLLGDGKLQALNTGDWLVIACAWFFAGQVALIGRMVRQYGRPFYWSVLQYGFCAIAALSLALTHEVLNLNAIMNNIWPLLYEGILSGGVAYTLQTMAQRRAPSSDAAIIMSGEALFAALGGVVLLHENLKLTGWMGCAIIFAAILMTELGTKKS
jgi:drug/metabolite transporter (DMT)-like permease